MPADVLSPNVHHQTHCRIQSKAYCLYFISNLCYIRTDQTPCKMLNWIWWDTAILLEFRVHWCALYPGVSTDLSTAGQQINGKQTTEFSWLSPVFIYDTIYLMMFNGVCWPFKEEYLLYMAEEWLTVDMHGNINDETKWLNRAWQIIQNCCRNMLHFSVLIRCWYLVWHIKGLNRILFLYFQKFEVAKSFASCSCCHHDRYMF